MHLKQAFSTLSDKNQQTQQLQLGTGGTLDIMKLNQKVDDIYQSLCACIQNHCASKDELSQLQLLIDSKVTKEDFDVQLLQKANKQSVANALQRKANKADMTALEGRMNELNQTGNFEDRIEDLKKMFDRQKEQYVELLHSEITIAKGEIESSLKCGVSKELIKINAETDGIQDSFRKYVMQIKEVQEGLEKRSEDCFKSLSFRMESLDEAIKKDIASVITVQEREFKKYAKMEEVVKQCVEAAKKNDKGGVLNTEALTQEMMKLSKETYYEFDMIDSKPPYKD